VAFLGESGRGKSTLAASFATEGTRFLTDDGLLLEWVGGHCMIVPSHPSIRLWEDSQEALISDMRHSRPGRELHHQIKTAGRPGNCVL
jgi:hypothetical protein